MKIHGLENTSEYSSKDTYRFLFRFITKALFIALLFIIISISSIALIVIGDSVYNMKKGNNVVPLIGGYVIITPSMVPTIKVKDAVLVKRTNNTDLTIGDIITFKSTDVRYNGLIITHRIVGTQTITNGDLVYRTKGDNNRIEDSAVVDFKNVYGKVILKLPKLGYVKDFIAKPIGFIMLIIVPLLGIIGINIANLRKKREMI